jgi:hypothetical protein
MMLLRHPLLLGHRHCCALSSMLPPSTPLHKQARMGNNVKALLSVPPPPLLLHTINCATAVIAIVQESKKRQTIPPRHHHLCRHRLLSLRTPAPAAAVITIAREDEEQPTMPRHCHLCRRHHFHSARSFAPMPLPSLPERARNSQRCHHGTIFRTAAVHLHCRRHFHHTSGQGMANNGAKAPSSTLPASLLCTIIHPAAINAAAGASKEQSMMPRHHCLRCCHHRRCAQLFMLLPSLPSQERARNGQ